MSLKPLALPAVIGLITGLLWWCSVSPQAYPLGLLLAGHLLAALALAAALHLARLRGPLPWLGAWLLAALVLPPALTPFHAAGLLGGKTGAVFDLLVLCGGAVVGALCGQLISRGRRAAGAIGGLLSVGAALGAAMWALGAIPEESQPTARRVTEAFPAQPVAVLGIDGGDWQVLDPLLARGELPTLQALIDRGRHGVLRSMDPMASPVIWTSIFTGDTPTTHGLEDWFRSDARSRKVPTLWDVFDAHGRSSLTVNVPGSWPPPAALKGGTLLSGFPIPGLAGGDTGHLRGRVITSGDDRGEVPTTVAERDGAAFVATFPVAAPELEPRLKGVEHVLLRLLAREAILPIDGATLTLRLTPNAESATVRVTVAGDFTGGPLTLSVGEWSAWLPVERAGLRAFVKLHLLSASAEGVQLFVSPAFQDPRAPRHEFAHGVLDRDMLLDARGPYVVEGLGWTAHRDPRVAHLVPDMVFDVADGQLRVAERALVQGTYDLVSYVYTATDRLQHPFWSLHDPAPYGDWRPPQQTQGHDYVEEAYRRADDALARVLAAMPDDTLVFVVSDHGVDAHDGRMEEGEAGHRSDGFWIAAGPGVPADPERLELRVIDVMPTALRCAGAPIAEDLDGVAVVGVCPSSPEPARVATYLGEAGSVAAEGHALDAEQLDMVQALGYVEEDEPEEEDEDEGGR